jgi:integrase
MKANVWVRKRKLKRGHSYAVQWQDPRTGQTKTESCGKDKAYANHLAAERKVEIRKGLFQGITSISFENFIDEEVNLLTGKAEATTDLIYRTLERFYSICSPKAVSSVDYRMLEHFKAERLKEVKIATVNKDLRTLQGCFTRAKKRHYINENPINRDTRKTLFDAEPKPQPRPIPFSVFQNMLDHVPNDLWRGFLTIGYFTGLRSGEISFLEWKDLDLVENMLYVRNKPEHKIKDHEERDVPMSPEVVEAIRLLLPTKFYSSYVLTSKNLAGRPFFRNIKRGYDKIQAKAGIEMGYTPHNLRDSFITNQFRAGADPELVRQTAGHSSLETTMKYYYLAKSSDKAKAINRVSESFSQTA